jgi:hypothetical protein
LFINQPNKPTPVGMIDPSDSSPYELPEFIPELKSFFILKPREDLIEKMIQMTQYDQFHSKKQKEEEKEEKNNNNNNNSNSNNNNNNKDFVFTRNPLEENLTMEQKIAKAVIYARNNNLQGVCQKSHYLSMYLSIFKNPLTLLIPTIKFSWKLLWMMGSMSMLEMNMEILYLF